MRIEVNGARLWYDVEGASLHPSGATMRERPTVVLVHGGPGSYDHSYFKPHFGWLAELAQVVYLDLRDHGRSSRHAPSAWNFELCADDLRRFCDAVGIERPIVFGHSMGGFVAIAYAARHPAHPAGMILQSTMARFDLDRLVEGFREAAGDEVADLARRDYGGDPIGDAEWARVFAAFGPVVPDADTLARRIRNAAVGERGMDLMRRLDMLDFLARVTCPTLVCTGDLDAVTPVAAAREILAALPAGVGRLEVVEGAGHFPWLDRPSAYRQVIETFVATAAGGRP